LVPGKTAQPSLTAQNEPADIPTQTSIVSSTEQGWKITIKNADGTSNEVTIEPKPNDSEEDAEKTGDETDDKVSMPSTCEKGTPH
jgi:hypothetical protein